MRERYQWTVTFKNTLAETVKIQVLSEGGSEEIEYPAAEEMAVEGYRFTGFPVIETPVTENITVTGNYVKTWAVTFYNANNEVISEQTVDNGTAASEPDAETRNTEGYVFKGWDKAFDNVTADTAVQGVYTKLWQVVFYNGNNEIISSQTVKNGEAAIEPAEAERAVEGYEFVSWDVSFDNILKDTSVYGFYVKVTNTDPVDPNEPTPTPDEYFNFTYLSETDSYAIAAKDFNNIPA